MLTLLKKFETKTYTLALYLMDGYYTLRLLNKNKHQLNVIIPKSESIDESITMYNHYLVQLN